MAAKQTQWIDPPGHGDAGTVPRPPVFLTNGPPELSAATGESFGRQVSAAMRGCHSIELNLAGTHFMDCAGLGVLIALGKLARHRQGRLRVTNPTPPVSRLFAILQAEDLFEIGHPAVMRLPGMPGVPPLELLPAVTREEPAGNSQLSTPFCLPAGAVKSAA
jgi:anti-anti-sigma factor